jgi:hypothetical protein
LVHVAKPKRTKRKEQKEMVRSNEPKYFKIGDALQATVNAELLPLFRAYHVNIGDRTDFRYVMHKNRRGQYVEDNDGTTDRYDCPTRQFWQFCAETGNYQDMMLLCFVQATNESRKCPAMRVDPKGTPLLNGNNTDSLPVMRTDGTQYLSAGGYKGQTKTMGTFQSAISNIHCVHGHSGAYVEACEDCRANRDHGGCESHRNTRLACYVTCGNPTKSNEFKTNFKSLKDPNYHPNACSQIDPEDVRNIRDACLGTGTLAGLKMYVQIIIAIKLFLRADEVVKMEVAHFLPTLFLRTAGVLHVIGLWISGKKDENQKIYFNLWPDHEYPEFCALSHLLIYIHAAGIRGGFLFPSDIDLHDPNVGTNGIYIRHETYHQLLGAFKKVGEVALAEYSGTNVDGKEFKLTVHICRKASYNFRVSAYENVEDIDWVLLKFDARHSQDKDAETYIRDAMQNRQYQDVAPNPRMAVSCRQAVRIKSLHIAEKHVRRSSDATNLTLSALATWFVGTLGCPPGSHYRILLEAAARLDRRQVDDIRNNLMQSLNLQQVRMFRAIEEDNARSLAAAVAPAASAQPSSAVAASAVATSAADALTAVAPVQKKRKNEKKLQGRDRVNKAKGVAAKMAIVVELEAECPVDCSIVSYSGGCQRWIKTTMRPMLRCYRNHHSSNPNSFSTAWTGKYKADFGKCCCRGKEGQPCTADALD